LSFGKWEVNAFFRGAFGHSLVNTFRAFYEPRVGSQKSYNYVNTELANPDIKNAQFSSLYVEKADFFKLDNLTIARSLDMSNSKIFDSMQLSLNVQNAFVLTNYTGTDPEPALFDSNDGNPLASGIERRNSYYSSRQFTIGLNINF
jgi:iron complex outermembrane receptor protein